MTAFRLVVVLCLVVFNGAFVAVEFALIGTRRAAIDQRAEAGQRSAILAQNLQANLALMLAGAQLGITVCSLALGRLAEPTVAHLLEAALDGALSESMLHPVAFVVALTIVVFIHVLFGEMVPKNLTLVNSEKALLLLAPPMSLYFWLVKPITKSLLAAANGILGLLRVETISSLADVATPFELELMVAESHRGGLIDAEEHALLGGALRFGATSVSEVMTPLEDVDAVRITDSVETLERVFVRTDHARLVVCGAERSDVRGFVHSKDLLSVASSARTRPLPVRRVRPMLRVGSDVSLPEVLQLMRRARTHLAVVSDTSGTAIGVMTLDDVFGGLLGDLAI
ncbi:MAG: CBS domain containing-hemolysin-like protein [Candidatus Poriferisodalaceae bacterium]